MNSSKTQELQVAVGADTPLEPPDYQPGATTRWNHSWHQLYDQFAQAILAYARGRGLNEHSARDVLQEVMMTVIRSQCGQAARHDPAGGNFQAWLWGVIRNRVRGVRRKNQRDPGGAEDGTDGAAAPGPQTSLVACQEPPDFGRLEEAQWRQALFAAAMVKVKARVSPVNFSIYSALLQQTATVEELAARHHKNANAIYALKHRCESIFMVEARAIRAAWEGLRNLPPVRRG